jgi:SagB-type dehydrogenase family enzyme
MSSDFSKIFHLFSKDHGRGHQPIPLESDLWPEEWKTTYYKMYERFPKIALDKQIPESIDLFSTIRTRNSDNVFSLRPIFLKELSLLMEYSCGKTSLTKSSRFRRAHPSAGARYPIETYYFNFRSSNELPEGLYHYNVRDHVMDVLPKEQEFTPDYIDSIFAYPWVKNASGAIVMTSVFDRTQNKYGERGYRYVLLEAGHIGQNIQLVSNALGLKSCPMAGTRDELIEQILEIDGITESVMYTVIVGK